MLELVYKICTADEWKAAGASGMYGGSPDDRRDGYIHLSSPCQVRGTLARHFSSPDGRGLPDLVLVGFRPDSLGEALRWEPSRNGENFPHLYGQLDPGLAVSILELGVAADGRHDLPGGFP